MVTTPWGDAAELRARKLRPGAGRPRAEVIRNQRERLFGAMIASVAEKGYEATTVADLVRISGVSRSDFYEHFAGKEACALACLEEVIAEMRDVVLRSYDGRGGALRKLIELIAEQPATARFCFVEVYAAGPLAVAMIDDAARPLEDLFEQRLQARGGRGVVPPELSRAIVGGLRKVVHTRLYRGEAGQLARLVDELRAWSLAYEALPGPLPVPRRTISRRPQFDGYTVAQRIARAVAAVVAEKGYQAIGTGDIAERAAISLSTFYAHFKNKEEAMLASIELVGALVLATVGPPVRRAADWRDGVVALHQNLCAFLAAEPDFAVLTISEVYTAGPRALAGRDRIIDSLARMLAPGYAEHPQAPPIAAEAIGGATYALLRDQLQAGGPAALPAIAPLASYITLAPFVGAAEAFKRASKVQ